MKKLLLVTVLIVLSIANARSQDNIILQIDDEKITLEEFKRIYFKNNKDSALTLESLEEYLKLFTNFKLKVHEAKALDLDEKQKFKKELSTYRKQLVKPYLTDSSTDEKLIREAYNRMKHIVRASHILFKIPKNATPEDTARIYQNAKNVLKKLRNGADFTEMAKKHSKDRSVRFNEGDLGYFSAFKMVYPFENAAYSLEVGEISDLVRTQFGYHIIKVTDRKPAPGKTEAAHIMVRMPRNANEAVKKKARQKIDSIYDLLKSGKNFETLAKKFSEDPQTASKGGKLPEFQPGSMLPDFEQKIFSLENGTYSEPFRTKVGWHIVKKMSNDPVGSFKEERAKIKRKLSKTQRAKLSRKKVIEQLKKDYDLKCKDKQINKLFEAINKDSLMKGKWALNTDIKENKEICRFADQSLTAGQLAAYIQNHLRKPKNDAMWFLEKRKEKFIDREIIEYEKAHLEDKYPDFAWLMKEYHDGILLFDITDSVVWKQAVKDTTGLKKYFENHRDQYMWEKRMAANIIKVKPCHKIKKARKVIEKACKNDNTENIEQLLHEKLDDTTITVQVDSGKYEKGVNRYVKVTEWEKGLHLAEKNSENAVFVYNREVISPRRKELSEARGLVTADYQNYLEKEWIAQLKEKYEVVVDKSLLKKLVK